MRKPSGTSELTNSKKILKIQLSYEYQYGGGREIINYMLPFSANAFEISSGNENAANVVPSKTCLLLA